MASVAAFQAGPLMSVYSATKHFVLAFSEALSEELSDSNVSITVLCPGPTISGFQKGQDFLQQPDYLQAHLLLTPNKLRFLDIKN